MPTRPTVSTLAPFTDDPTTPPPVLAELGDWLSRWETAAALLRQLRTAGDAARTQLDTAKRQAPQRLMAALSTGKVSPDLIGSDLPALRQAVDTTQDRYAITERAMSLCVAELNGGVFRRHLDTLLPWVARHRMSAPPAQPVPAHVELVWAQICSAYVIHLPYEACVTTGDTAGVMFPLAIRLSLRGGDTHHPADRHRWAWQAIAENAYAATTKDRRYMVKITADWSERDQPPAPAKSYRMPPRSERVGKLGPRY